jgi:hypothetical protein
LLSNGNFDLSYNITGVSVLNGGYNHEDFLYDQLSDANGNTYYAGGQAISTPYTSMMLMEVLPSANFGNGLVWYKFNSERNDCGYAMDLDTAGKVVMAGSSKAITAGISSSSICLMRSNKTVNNYDSTFGTCGRIETTFNGSVENESYALKLQPLDNKIVIAGFSSTNLIVARYFGTDNPNLDSFKLLSPLNNAFNVSHGNATLDWSAALGATNYELTLDTFSNFSTAAIYNLIGNSYYYTSALVPSKQYYWKVRAGNGTTFGALTPTWTFTTTSLESFTLTTPANNAINQSINNLVFNWTDEPGATGYDFQLADNNTFTAPITNTNVVASTYTQASLLPNTTYYWRVRAKKNAIVGQWKNAFHLEQAHLLILIM